MLVKLTSCLTNNLITRFSRTWDRHYDLEGVDFINIYSRAKFDAFFGKWRSENFGQILIENFSHRVFGEIERQFFCLTPCTWQKSLVKLTQGVTPETKTSTIPRPNFMDLPQDTGSVGDLYLG
jgi:hypothetical protein